MMENQWIEIFKAGTHKDSSGRVRTFTETDLERIVKNYNPNLHEAPLVIGHPKENAPAFGWVQALKKVGETLFFKAQQVVPEFSEMVKAGLFKKRSISLYPDMRLRHVGFLGAMPPSLKGLNDIAFSEEQMICMSFTEDEADLYAEFDKAFHFGCEADLIEIKDEDFDITKYA